MTMIGASPILQRSGTPIPNRIFVGGISENSSDTELRQFFSSFGPVVDCKIVFDRTGVSKGYGFVTFERQEDAQALIRKDRKEGTRLIFKEKKLNIGEAVRKHSIHSNGSKYDAVNYSRPSEASILFDIPPGSPACETTAIPQSMQYVNGVPYTYQNGMAIFNPQPGSIGFSASPQIVPMASTYPQMLVPVVSQHACLPPVASYCSFPGTIMPVGVVSPFYGGHAANSIETLSCPATVPASVEPIGGGVEPFSLMPLPDAMGSSFHPSKLDVDACFSSPLRRVCPASGTVPYCGLYVVPPVFRYGHHAA